MSSPQAVRAPAGSSASVGLGARVVETYRRIGAWKVEHDVLLAGDRLDVYVELATPARLVHRVAVEVKDSGSPVEVDAVREFAQKVDLLRSKRLVDEGAMVSLSGFSQPARRVGHDCGIRLLEPPQLEGQWSPV